MSLPGFHPDEPSVVSRAVCQVPTGQHGKAWDTGTLELRRGPGRALSQGKVWERLAPPGIFQLYGGSQEAATTLLGTAEARRQGLGPSLWSLQTDYSAPGGCFQSSVSKGEGWSQRLGPAVGEEKAGQVRPLGPALALLSRGPGRGADRVEVVSLYKEAGRHMSGPWWAARTAWTAARPSAATAASPAGAPPPPNAW